ncbi:MAG: tRNA lysidine(34) synthetase TilS [Cyclobacteriaceae bacterium]
MRVVSTPNERLSRDIMYQSFLTFIKEKALIESSDRVLLTVSGGVDSMVMLHLCRLAEINVAVAHVNFGLRGKASDADALMVERLCRKQGVPFYLREVKQEEYDTGLSIQMTARAIRYAFFEELVAQHGFDKVATAHNQNDSLETVLLNLSKGTGIAGLTGIAHKKGRIIRPLLFATKEEIYEYARQEHIPWREDKSNTKSDYQRNLIRNEVVPLLQKINPSLIANFHLTQERIQGTYEMVTSQVNETKSQVKEGIEESVLNVDWYRDDAKSLTLLSELIKEYGFNHSDAKDLGKAILKDSTGSVFESEGYVIHLDRGNLHVQQKEDLEVLEPVSLDLGQTVVYGKFSFSLEKIKGSALPKKPSRSIAYFDAGKVKFPLAIRPFVEGDSFSPLGLKGSKKVSDFFVDNKVALHKKGLIPIVESDGEIVWIAGYRLDDRFKIDENTDNMIRLEMKNLALS